VLCFPGRLLSRRAVLCCAVLPWAAAQSLVSAADLKTKRSCVGEFLGIFGSLALPSGQLRGGIVIDELHGRRWRKECNGRGRFQVVH
jgi:hypothetical protein